MSYLVNSIAQAVTLSGVPGHIFTAEGGLPVAGLAHPVSGSIFDYLSDPKLLIETLLHNYGGWMVGVVALIVFIESGVLFPVLPGDSMIFALGIFHKQIPVPVAVTAGVLVVAAILGNVVGYWLGKVFGRRLFKEDARFLSVENLKKAEDFFVKYGGRSLVLARFVPFVRTFVPIAAGIAAFKFSSFILWNIVGAVVWIAAFLLAGEFLGGFPFITDNIEAIAILIILISVLPMIVEYVRARFKGSASKVTEVEEEAEQIHEEVEEETTTETR